MINMPFFSPKINPFDSGRGIFRVNTERRFLPPFKKNGVGAGETLAMKELENTLFTDSFETEGILSDENLLERIKAGVKQAKERKGRFEVIVLRPTRK